VSPSGWQSLPPNSSTPLTGDRSSPAGPARAAEPAPWSEQCCRTGCCGPVRAAAKDAVPAPGPALGTALRAGPVRPARAPAAARSPGRPGRAGPAGGRRLRRPGHPSGRPGLGAHVLCAHAHAESAIPVIGVAKSRFRAATHAMPVLRGTPVRPLSVTAAGMPSADRHHLPDALRRADTLARAGAPAVSITDRQPDPPRRAKCGKCGYLPQRWRCINIQNRRPSIGHTGTVEMPRQRPDNRAPTRLRYVRLRGS
jgi:hypothetical protein